MARNKHADIHPAYDKRHMTKEEILHKRAYDKKYASSKKRRKYRASLNKANREDGLYGKMWKLGLDRSHTKSGRLVKESRHDNRARNGSNGKSTKKNG